MKILGTEGMSKEAIRAEVDRGARFVIYQYCISIVFMSFKRPSEIYFLRAGEGGGGKGVLFTLLSCLLGWWGFPWGPIWTIQSIWINSRGGRDVTQQIVASATPAPSAAIPQARRA